MDDYNPSVKAAILQENRNVETDSLGKILGKADRQTKEFKEGKLKLVKKKLNPSDFEHKSFSSMYMLLKFRLQADDTTILRHMPLFALNNNCFAPGQANPRNGTVERKKKSEDLPEIEFPVEILARIMKYVGVKDLLNIRAVSVDMYLLAHEQAKRLMARKRGLKMLRTGCGKGVDCSCVQDIVGIYPSLVRPIPFDMESVGTLRIKKMRSRIVGNASHLFVVAQLIQQGGGKENTDSKKYDNAASNDANVESDEGSSSDMDDSSDEDSIDVTSIPTYHLHMYDRKTLKLVKTLGRFSSGLQVKVQIYRNTLLVLDKTTLAKKVVIFDVTIDAEHVWTFDEFEVCRDVVRAMKYTDHEDVYIENADLVKDKVVIYCNCNFDAMAVLYSLDTDEPTRPALLKVFHLSYVNKRPLWSLASNTSFCLVIKDNGRPSSYTVVWQDFKDLDVKVSNLNTTGIFGECRIDLATSAICITTGRTEDFLVKPGCLPFKIFHDNDRNPQSRKFMDGVYFTVDHGRLSSNDIRSEGIGVWHPLAEKIDTDHILCCYQVDKFGVIGVGTDDYVAVYKYPPVLKKIHF